MTTLSEAELDRILADLLAAEDAGEPFDETALFGLPPRQMLALAEFLTDHREVVKEFALAIERQ